MLALGRSLAFVKMFEVLCVVYVKGWGMGALTMSRVSSTHAMAASRVSKAMNAPGDRPRPSLSDTSFAEKEHNYGFEEDYSNATIKRNSIPNPFPNPIPKNPNSYS